jgi:hypothetical protein
VAGALFDRCRRRPVLRTSVIPRTSSRGGRLPPLASVVPQVRSAIFSVGSAASSICVGPLSWRRGIRVVAVVLLSLICGGCAAGVSDVGASSPSPQSDSNSNTGRPAPGSAPSQTGAVAAPASAASVNNVAGGCSPVR